MRAVTRSLGAGRTPLQSSPSAVAAVLAATGIKGSRQTAQVGGVGEERDDDEGVSLCCADGGAGRRVGMPAQGFPIGR